MSIDWVIALRPQTNDFVAAAMQFKHISRARFCV